MAEGKQKCSCIFPLLIFSQENWGQKLTAQTLVKCWGITNCACNLQNSVLVQVAMLFGVCRLCEAAEALQEVQQNLPAASLRHQVIQEWCGWGQRCSLHPGRITARSVSSSVGCCPLLGVKLLKAVLHTNCRTPQGRASRYHVPLK